jgi:hypothetical protein
MAWLKVQTPDSYGYVKLTIKESRDGKPYVALDTYQKGQAKVASKPVETIDYPEEETDINSIPF